MRLGPAVPPHPGTENADADVLSSTPAGVEIRYFDAGGVEFRDRTDMSVAEAGFEEPQEMVKGVQEGGSEYVIQRDRGMIVDGGE